MGSNESSVGKNPPQQILENPDENNKFIKLKDGTRIFCNIRNSDNNNEKKKTIYLLAGITGFNHVKDSAVIDTLETSLKYKVVSFHPRGCGYSDGKRGNVSALNIVDDFVEILEDRIVEDEKNVLFGHSMSCSIAMEMFVRLKEKGVKIDGLIIVNPPVKMKKSEGMSPSFMDIVNFGFHTVFARDKVIVNMSGDPKFIKDKEEKKESQERSNDVFVTKYFSMKSMIESKKVMDSIINNAKKCVTNVLLLCGENDSLCDRKGTDELFKIFKGKKTFHLVKKGPHGVKTVIDSVDIIKNWLDDI